MAGIKAKISNLLHKDKDHPHDTAGTTDDYATGTGTTTGTGTGLGTTTGTGSGLGTTTGTGSGLGTTIGTGYDTTRGEQDARTGISDLDINKGSTGTGLRSDRDTEYGRTGTGLGSTSTTTTTGTGYGTTGTGYGTTGDVSQGVTRSYDNTTNEIIDQERFTKTEDHEIVIEKKAYELEHRPVEKKYVVETKYMGEREVPGKATEILGTDAREVEERVVEMPRGDRTIIVENVDVPVGYESAGRAINEHGTTGTTSYSSTTGQTGTGYGTGTGTGLSGTGTGSGLTGQTGTGYGTGTGSGTGTGYGGTGGAGTKVRELAEQMTYCQNRDSLLTRSTMNNNQVGQNGNNAAQTGSRSYNTLNSASGRSTNGDISQGITRSYDNSTNEIIDQERFTKTEDHEIVIEKKAYELEHRPVEKKYVVETMYMGERTLPGKAPEILSTEAREVEERIVEMPRGDRTIIVENVDVPVGLETVDRAINQHSTGVNTGISSTNAGYSTLGSGQTSSAYNTGNARPGLA